MTDVRESAARFIRAFNAHDENALRALNDPNHTLIAPGGIQLRGAETTAYAAGWLRGCPDGKLTVEHQIISEPWVLDEVRFEGTHQGPLEGPMGSIPATGKKLDVRAALVTRYQNDLAIETKVYFDQADVLGQLGVMPTREAVTV